MPHHDTYGTNDASTDLELVENRRANLSTLNHAVNYDTKVRAGCKRWEIVSAFVNGPKISIIR